MPSELKVNKLSPYTGTTLTIGDSGDTISFASGVLPSLESLTITGDLTVDTTTLKVDSTNNRVGIGTASPSYDLQISKDGGGASVRLDVVNTGVAANDDTLLSFVGGSNNNENIIYFGDTDDNNVGIIRYNHASDHMSFTTNASEAMRIDSSGNVLIGGTSASALDGVSGIVVGSSTASTGGIAFENSAHSYIIYSGSSNDSLLFYDSTNDVERMRIDSSGNVLVGKTTAINPALTEGIHFAQNGAGYFTKDGGHALQVGRLTSDGDFVSFRKDGTIVGSIGVIGGDIPYFGTTDGSQCGINLDGDNQRINPANGSGSAVDNQIDLGASPQRFKNLYLGGSVYLGGTGSANALDDYEEGTWTPTLGVGSWGTVYFATYTKIGKIVYVNMRATAPSNTTNTGAFTIENLPFTQAGGGEYAVGSVMINYITTLTNDVDITPISYPGNNIVRLFAQDRVGGNWDAVEYSFLSASTNVYLSLWYNTNT